MGGDLESRCLGRVPHTRPTQRLSRSPPIQNLGAENHMLNSASNAPDDGRLYLKLGMRKLRKMCQGRLRKWSISLLIGAP